MFDHGCRLCPCSSLGQCMQIIRSMQAMRFSLLLFADNLIIFTNTINFSTQIYITYLCFNPSEPWATPVLHDIKLVIKGIS